MQDIRTRADIESALDCQTISTTGEVTGNIIDLAEHEALDMCFNLEVTTGILTVALYDSDASNMAGEVVVDDDFLIGDLASTVPSGTNTIHIGYVGNKRYVRAKVTGSDTPNMVVAGIAYKGKAQHCPTV